MNRRISRWLSVGLLLLLGLTAQAQGGVPLVAFVNDAGQLVVASGDSSVRWIVTNPGEQLHPTLGFTWSPDGSRLFYAVQSGGGVSLRVGDVNAQAGTEFASVGGSLAGGDWLGSTAVVVAVDGVVTLYDVNSGGAQPIANGTLLSSFTNQHPNLYPVSSTAPDSRIVFTWDGGSWLLVTPEGGQLPLPNATSNASDYTGLWLSGGLIAYRGIGDDGSSLVGVAATDTGAAVTLASGRSTPMYPEAWLPNSANLLYRDTALNVRLADVACLFGGCGANPLENGIVVLPAGASEVQTDGRWAYFRENDTIRAVDLGCVNSDSCLASAVTLGANAAPRTMLHVRGSILVYTAYTQNALDPNDREIRAVNLNCLPNCQAQTILSSAVAGLLSDNGQYVVADILGDGMYAVRLNDLNRAYLSGSGTNLLTARWNG